MPTNLNLCFTKTKSQSSHSPPNTLPENNHSRPFCNPSQSLLIKNFNSLYDATADSNTAAPPPNFATAFASQRFFFSSPGRSNSIIDSSTSSSLSTSSSMLFSNDAVAEGSIAVHTYSPDPFADFRRSMQEMVEAREVHDVRESWDYLHELLLCYLSLNPKSTHKFIVGAFADLLVTLTTEKGKLDISRRRL